MTNPSGYLELSSFFVQIAIELRSLQFLFVEIVPVDILKPRIVLEGHKGRPAQSTFWLVFVQELVHKLPCLFVLQRTRILELQIQDLLVYFQWIFTLFAKGNITTHKLEHIDSEGVKTYSESISLADYNLRSHIMWRTYQCVCLCAHYIPALDHLRCYQVDQFDVTQKIDHKILRLQISHNDSLSRQILKDENHACNVKLSIFCGKNAYFSNGIVQLFPLHELHQRVQVMFILEAFIVLHDEGVIQTAEQILFLRDVLEQRVFFYLLLAVALQHIQLLFLHLISASDQQDRPKFSFFQLLEHDQLIQSIDQLVSSLYLLVKLLSLLLLVLFHDCVQESTYDFFDDIDLDLSNDSIRFHDNIILISRLCLVLQQELLSINLRPDCNRIDVLILLECSLYNNDDLLIVDVFRVLLDDDISALVAVDLHQVKYLLYLLSGQLRQMAAFLYGPFHEVSEGYHEYLIAQNFTQRLSAEDKAGHVLLSFYCHLPYGIVKQSLFSKGVSLLKFGHQLIPLIHRCSSFFYDVKGRAWISFIHDHLSLCVLLCDQCPSDGVFMIIGKAAKKPNILHKLFILLVFQDNNLLYCSPKGIPIDRPEMAMLTRLHRKGSRRLVQQCYLSKSIAHSQCLLDLIIGNDLHHSLLDYEEAHGLGLLGEDEGFRIDGAIEHLLGYVFNLRLTEVIKDEMILKTTQQESHLLIFLLLLLQVKLLIIVYLIYGLLAFTILSHNKGTYSSQPDQLRSLSLSISLEFPWFLNIINLINQFKKANMQKRVKRTLIGIAISIVVITVLLVLLGLAKVDLDQNALNYNTITSNYSDTTLYGPGLHWIGIANRFLRFNKNQQTLRFSNLSAFSSDFYRITANMEVTLQFNFSSGGDDFKAGSKFFTLFGENPMEIIDPLIKDCILIALSSQKSSFFQSTSQPNTVLQSTLSTSISSALLQWVTANVNVIVESVICEGSTSNTEIIDREIDSLIHDLQRTSVQQVELSTYFTSIYSNKQQQISSASTALSMKALQLQRIYQMYGTNTTGFNISHIIYDNRPLKYNLNLVNILEDLAIIANRTFPY